MAKIQYGAKRYIFEYAPGAGAVADGGLCSVIEHQQDQLMCPQMETVGGW